RKRLSRRPGARAVQVALDDRRAHRRRPAAPARPGIDPGARGVRAPALRYRPDDPRPGLPAPGAARRGIRAPRGRRRRIVSVERAVADTLTRLGVETVFGL